MKTNKPNFLQFLIIIFTFIGFLNSKAQNTCSTALPISAGTNTVSIIDGTNVTSTCSFGAKAEWYIYTPTVDKRVTITSDLLVNICRDTYFNIYTGNCNALTCLLSDDDSGTIICNSGANTFSYLSKLSFDATAGVSYYICWSNRWETYGFDFQLTEQSIVSSPCSTATTINAGITTVAVINDPNLNTSCSNASLAEWYKYIPTQNYRVTVSSDLITNICIDTNFSVYTGNCNGVLQCVTSDDNSGDLACNAGNTNSNLSKKTFSAVQGTTFYIVWDNKWSNAGFDFELTQNPFPCQGATPLNVGSTTIPVINSPNLTSTCSLQANAAWYSYTPTSDFIVTLSSDLSTNLCKNTKLIVYKGSCPNALVCYKSDDDSGILACNVDDTSLLSKKSFAVTAGEIYYIVWENIINDNGFTFELSERPVFFPVRYITEIVPTIDSSYNICVVDMNNDFKDDIVGVNNNQIKIHYQNNNAPFTINTFLNAGTLIPNWSLAAGDLNKDGYNDLMIGNGNGASFLTSNSTGTGYTALNPGQYIFCQRTNFIDINNDGNLDAFACHDIAPNVYYMNDGLGNLTYNQSGVTPGAYSLGVMATGGNYASLWTDYDNDGDQDMFISKCSGPASELHRNDGAGVFTDVSVLAAIDELPVQSWSSAIDDFDNDGDMDIMVGTNGTNPNYFFQNNLDKSNNVEEAFTNITLGSGFDQNTTANRDYVSYDFDNDGKVDILGSGNKIMFNQGNNTFEPTFYSSIEVGAIGDLNNDGFLDIQNGNKIKFAIPNGNNWLKITYQGIQSNKNGIGSRVEIYGAWGKQIRDVRSGEGFEYMSTLNTHFGIGTATSIDKIIIRWPSGKVDQILNPAINQTLLVVEGATTLSNKSFELSNFRISPNPVSDVLTFTFDNNSNEIKSIEIMDISGKVIANTAINSNSIDVKKLSPGLYFLVLKDKNSKQFIYKFIKK